MVVRWQITLATSVTNGGRQCKSWNVEVTKLRNLIITVGIQRILFLGVGFQTSISGIKVARKGFAEASATKSLYLLSIYESFTSMLSYTK